MSQDEAKKKERATLVTLRNTMDKISGNLYEAKADLQYIVTGKSKDEENEKCEDRQSPTLEDLQNQLEGLLDVAHDCQTLVSQVRA